MEARALALALALMMLLAPAVALAADVESSDTFTGRVTVKAAQPTVSFNLYSDANYSIQTTEITPQTPVYMKISVSGSNPLEEAVITVHLYAGTNSSKVDPIPSTTSPETYVKFTISYDSAQGTWVLTPDTGGSTTWSIQLDPNKQQPDPTLNYGDFYVIITFGKTAREANTGDNAPYADWDIVVNATIGSGSLASSGSAASNGYTVYFYSEINVQANTVDFGILEPNSQGLIQEVDGVQTNNFTVWVLANGYYDLKATSTNWTNSTTGHNITLVESTSPSNGEFALEISDEFNQTANDLLNPVLVAKTLINAQPFVNDAQPTTESGTTYSVFMKIILGNNIYTGTYEGTVTIYAVDGS